jgi:hypothetical protein
MASRVGKDAAVKLGTDQVLGIGNWSMDGLSRQELDDTEFGDQRIRYLFGIIDGGTISFAGNHDPGDTTGQQALDEAFDANTEITNLRLYVDNTSYYEPCRTTGYLSPAKTTGANTVLSHVSVTGEPVNYDKGALGAISFTMRVTGGMVLV